MSASAGGEIGVVEPLRLDVATVDDLADQRSLGDGVRRRGCRRRRRRSWRDGDGRGRSRRLVRSLGWSCPGRGPFSCGEPAARAPVAPRTSRLAAMVAASAGRGVIAASLRATSPTSDVGPSPGAPATDLLQTLQLDDLGLLIRRPSRRRSRGLRRSRRRSAAWLAISMPPWWWAVINSMNSSSASDPLAEASSSRSASHAMPGISDGSTAWPIQAIACRLRKRRRPHLAEHLQHQPDLDALAEDDRLGDGRNRGSVSGRRGT